MSGRGMTVSVGIIATILVLSVAKQADSVLAPVAFALFIIAIVWPLQRRLQSLMPRLLALAIVMVVTVSVGLCFAAAIVWGVGNVWRAMIADTAHYEMAYGNALGWLEAHGVSVRGIWAEHFDTARVLRIAQQVGGRLHTTSIFWIVTLTYVILGLLEVEDMRDRVAALKNREAARILLEVGSGAAMQFRRYMVVRTLMSVLTGLLVWAFARAVGLPFAQEWGVIAFALNYIPFVGPFIATLLPTLLAMLQFDTWLAVVVVFICLNVIQFAVGSYVEPRIAGNVLSMAPSLVLFAVFLWTFLWGFPGTFIGVPITITILAFFRANPKTRWIGDLLGKGGSPPPGT